MIGLNKQETRLDMFAYLSGQSVIKNGKVCRRQNTLAYWSRASVSKEKRFLALSSVDEKL